MMANDLYEFLILKLYDGVSGTDVQKRLREFRSVRDLEVEAMRELQFRKMKRLLIHAEKNSPYYRRLFRENGIAASEVEYFEDVKQVPVLTRERLVENSRDIISETVDVENLNKGSSSGSTGKPVTYYTDNCAKSAGLAAGYLAWELGPWKFGMKGLHIWGNPDTVEHQWDKVSSKIKSHLFRLHKFPAYRLTEEGQFEELFETCRKSSYRFIDGYTNAIYLFAEYLKAKKLRLPSVEMVLTTGENLQEYQRKAIEEMIAPVYDLYGCSEINGIANECVHCGRYHTVDPHVYVEFGEEVNKEGDCPLIITDLDNFAFPLIRYENGDMAVPAGENRCREPFGSIERISGRQSDLIRLPGGGVFSVPSFFGSALLKQVQGIRQYQVVRDRTEHVTIKLVVDSSFSKIDEEKIKASVSGYLQNRIGWDIEYHESIPVSATGKFRLVIDLTRQRQGSFNYHS